MPHARVAVHCGQRPEEAGREAGGGRACAAFGDVADWDDANRIVRTAIEQFGDLHIVMNNAGITRDGMIVKMTEEQFERSSASIRANLAFYGSTPAYRVTLEHHGLGDLQPRLRDMVREGRWADMASVIDDEVVDLLAVRGSPEACARRLRDEYGGLADRVSLTTHNASDEAIAGLCAALAEQD